MATSWQLRRRLGTRRAYRPFVELLEARQLLSAGALDPTFGNGGQVVAGFTPFVGGRSVARAVVLQPDGKIVVAGFATNPSGGTDFAAARLNPDGSFDGGFGPNHNGTIVVPFPGAGTTDAHADAVALQPDGKIVLAGCAGDFDGCGGGVTGAGQSNFAAARLDADGTLDNSFGTKGTTTVNFAFTRARADGGVVVQPDGKIVLTGTTLVDLPSFDGFAAARLDASGKLDQSFGGHGSGTVAFRFPNGGNDDATGNGGVALQPDGKIVLAGNARSPAGDKDFAAARLQADGTLDPTFGTAGKTTVAFNLNPGGHNDDIASSVALQPDGKIVLAGMAPVMTPNMSDFAAARLNANGTPDGTFGGGGQTTVAFGSAASGAAAVALQPDGKIVLAGSAFVGVKAIDFAAARLNANGALDGTFGDGGQTTVAFGSPFSLASAVALQPDDKIVLAGFSGINFNNEQFAVARLAKDAQPPALPAPTPPAATGVSVFRGGRAGKVQGLVVFFNEALDPVSAQNLAHYTLLIPRKGKGKKSKPRIIPIRNAVYNPSTHTVTLTLGKLKSTDTQGTLQVMGVTDPAGDLLSGTAVFAVDLRPRRKKH